MSASEVIDLRIIPEKETIGEWGYKTIPCFYCQKVIKVGRQAVLGIFGSYYFEGKLYDKLDNNIACLECVEACICTQMERVGVKCLMCKKSVCKVHHYNVGMDMCKACVDTLLQLI